MNSSIFKRKTGCFEMEKGLFEITGPFCRKAGKCTNFWMKRDDRAWPFDRHRPAGYRYAAEPGLAVYTFIGQLPDEEGCVTANRRTASAGYQNC